MEVPGCVTTKWPATGSQACPKLSHTRRYFQITLQELQFPNSQQDRHHLHYRLRKDGTATAMPAEPTALPWALRTGHQAHWALKATWLRVHRWQACPTLSA